MSKTSCKGIKRDGSPCQGHGLEQFDGNCIAPAPADLTRAWRSCGGASATTAARLDKRIPERLKQAIDPVHASMDRVAEGTRSPAAYNAIAAQQDRYRLASLVEQGYAEFNRTSDPDEPPEAVLTDKGRRRFGYHPGTK